MDNNRTVDVGTLLDSVAQTLKQNQAGLDNTGAKQGANAHGQRMAAAFQVAAQAARQSGSRDAGKQFAAAAEAMRRGGKGKATQYYANGLELAAQEFKGKRGITPDDLGPLLQALAGGAQKGNPAQPGQGSMLDALLPAAQGFQNARGSGQDPQSAAIQALGGAVMGAKNTQQAQRGDWFGGKQPTGGVIDPGAASATNIIGGIVGALLPHVLGAVMSRMGGGQSQAQQAPAQGLPQMGGDPNDPLGGLGGLGGLLGGLGGLLGGQGAQQGQGDPLGGLGALLGGGQAPQHGQGRQGNSQGNPLEDLLGGQSPLGGLFGGEQPRKDDSRYV
ncbi:MAG: dihydroxyacetone kinase subunit L [Chloroflexota bacterium]|nr:dihydroxyacetone kinase subunit L [Chloroflexota bacterium]MDQ5866459.1 dihydroxyacetone kinase subunit L [Chloroflexota bacterium]